MRLRSLLLLLCLLLTGPSAAWPVAGPGAGPCYDCHPQETFQGRFQHHPVAKGECGACHQPHVAKYPGLLARPEKELCFSCHQRFQQHMERKGHQHAPVAKGECGACHAPHQADNDNLLKSKPGTECEQCHTLNQAAYEHRHQPFAAGNCYACHDPHSADHEQLLKQGEPGICLSCHQSSKKLQQQHLGRELKELKCLGCHNPHGSTNAALLRSTAHQPFAQRQCGQCHGRPAGDELCLSCHQEVLTTFLQPHTHLRGAGDHHLCLGCHNPHVADQPALLTSSTGKNCRACHEDKFIRRAAALHLHPGRHVCTNCHTLHGSSRPDMLKDEPREVCASCHQRHKQFTHPLGENALDPRNHKPMDCVTCHDPCNGTMYTFNLRRDGKRSLCIQCHQKY
ncbi:MAG: hypothetical protein JXO49_00665 [Deltaproteobacteria bacterium]|nr:hypothetical protein [Candidatus Anaeroferrophillus wilburensis]MBN2887837.1 hypothetical protein [Deltaproteobacteria bacterium]